MTLRKLFLLIALGFVLGSCANKLICPAYQSSFIHDKEELRKKFSYFHNDSTPKVLTASKTKYLVAVPESYRKRYRKMQTVDMKEIHPSVPDSVLNPEPIKPPATDSTVVIDSAAQVRLDSAASASTDSVYMITKDKEVRVLKYNFPDSLHYDSATGKYVKESPYYYVKEVKYTTEQENYMWYFRKELILPDARMAKSSEAAKKKEAAGGTQTKKKGFFRKLMFWKKDKKKDSLNVVPANNIDTRDSLTMWYDSSAVNTPKSNLPDSETKTKKKGLKLFKKKKAETTDPAAPNQDAKKEEDEGF